MSDATITPYEEGIVDGPIAPPSIFSPYGYSYVTLTIITVCLWIPALYFAFYSRNFMWGTSLLVWGLIPPFNVLVALPMSVAYLILWGNSPFTQGQNQSRCF
jgi:hypothetical protein